MIRLVPTLVPAERDAVARLIHRVLTSDAPPLLHAALFGSKARGDFDEDSDVDVLLVCDVHPDALDHVGASVADTADGVAARTGVEVEPWVVAAADLAPGVRTPMLVDALDDAVPLWPADAAPLRVPFTPADACFCASCLLDWVVEGRAVIEAALREGRRIDAAGRARDDITRLATAVLLLTGDTRHRRRSSLDRFEARFLGPGSAHAPLRAAVAWAWHAFPGDGGRGRERPPVPARAAATAERGRALAAAMADALVPWILGRIETLERRAAGTISSPAATPPSAPPPPTAARRPRSGRFPYAGP